MSFSFRLPEDDPVCECRYDEIRDRMDREDCPFHCDIVDAEPAGVLEAARKPPASVGLTDKKIASAFEDRRRGRGWHTNRGILI
jgi:hypothetical protein